MARKRISLSQFRIESVPFDAGAELAHYYRQCDWSEDAEGLTPPEVTSAARSHARECDGQPRPRPARPRPTDLPLVPASLSAQLMSALTDSLTQPRRGVEAYLAEFGG